MEINIWAADKPTQAISESVTTKLQWLTRQFKLPLSSFDVYLVNNRTRLYFPRPHKTPFNVLSFIAPKGFPRPDRRGVFLGELYLNPDYIRRRGENFDHLLIHGFLHLLGYDHRQERDRMRMEKKEKALLQLLAASGKVRRE